MNQLNYSVSFRGLLYIYAIIPACLLIFLIDKFALNFSLRAALPAFPHDLIIINSLFGLPHILASTAILLRNQDYFNHYKYKIGLASGVIILGLSLGAATLSYEVMFFLVAAVSVAHVLKQQFGIGNMLCRMQGALYRVWGWSSIVVAIIIYSAMFQKNSYSTTQLMYLNSAAASLLCVHIALTVYWQWRLRSIDLKGKLFLWGNCAMILLTAWFYWIDYFFLAILAPRVIHDLTAFYIYITHDKNRVSAANHSGLYHLSRKFGVPIVWLWPAMAVVLAYFLQYQLDNSIQWAASRVWDIKTPIMIALAVVTFFDLLHYYTESFTWGKASPYRNYIKFSY
ncbi:MAG: hypothetical protein RL497_1194 [Pseudomonadota bacterium]|jgi:hypothetical protein